MEPQTMYDFPAAADARPRPHLEPFNLAVVMLIGAAMWCAIIAAVVWVLGL